MAKRTTFAVVLLSLAFLLLERPSGTAAAPKDPVKDGGKVVQEMKIEAPMMTEEDQHGYNMPRQYLCDACRAVVAHVNRTLVHRQPPSRRLKQWEYTEIFDEVCANDFEGYGIKLVGGVNVLSGPMLKEKEEEQLKAGGAQIHMGGDNWKKRMGEICRKVVYDKVGEEELYELFRKNGELTEDVCFSVTRDCHLWPDAAKKKKKEAAAAGSSAASSAGKKKAAAAAAAPAEKSSSEGKKNTFLSEKEDDVDASKKVKAKAAAADALEKLRTKKSKKAEKSSDAAPVDITYFLAELAVQHGLPPKEYTKNRSPKEWERTIVALAGKIFGNTAKAKAAAREEEEETEEEAAAMET